MPAYVNDGSANPPRLKVYLNLDNLADLPPGSRWPGGTGRAAMEQLLEDGFEGVQWTRDETPAGHLPFPYCGLDRISTPEQADSIVAKHAARAHRCITVHAGWGLEDDDAMDRLVEAILSASERHQLPVFIETHRSTITQDIWRTVRLTERFPGIRFNGDFSHYYTGQEMVYGGMDMKLDFMQPVFDRIAFIHGRIGSPGCVQVPIDSLNARPAQAHGEQNFLDHFREMWTRAMRGFQKNAGLGDQLIFAPELLSGRHYYARLFPDAHGELREESDRYQQALLYAELARNSFEAAAEGSI